MDNLQKYKPTDKMIDLISDNYSLLQLMSRFGLSLGFGDKTVKEVCELNGVDCRTFLIVVNFMSEGFSRMDGSSEDISIPALIDYLRQAHIYFLDFSLPAIRRKLIEAIDCSQDDVAFLILKFFDEYTREVRKHMEYENEVVFTIRMKAIMLERFKSFADKFVCIFKIIYVQKILYCLKFFDKLLLSFKSIVFLLFH